MVTKDELESKRYAKWIGKFCENFNDKIIELNLRDSTRTGFCFVFVRENREDCIDIASNLTRETQISILKKVLHKLETE
jgi:hypothetical protein